MESENSQYFSSRVFNDFLVLEWKNQDKTRHPAQTDGANCRTLREIALHWASERWVGKLQLLFCKQNSLHGFPSLILRCDFIRKIIIRSFLTYSTSSTSSACLPEGPMTDSGRNSDAIHHKTWNIISSAATTARCCYPALYNFIRYGPWMIYWAYTLWLRRMHKHK